MTLSLSTSLFCAIILAVVTACVRFKVSCEGVRTFSTFGRWSLVPWAAISSAVPAKYYFLPHLRLTVDGRTRSFWIPLFLSDMQGFRNAVIAYAGSDNPLSQALPVPARAAHRAAA
jgi:prepilin signal peptidase PulO-like enzyme (type II secretory pathway)